MATNTIREQFQMIEATQQPLALTLGKGWYSRYKETEIIEQFVHKNG
jgi:hypothetical protein